MDDQPRTSQPGTLRWQVPTGMRLVGALLALAFVVLGVDALISGDLLYGLLATFAMPFVLHRSFIHPSVEVDQEAVTVVNQFRTVRVPLVEVTRVRPSRRGVWVTWGEDSTEVLAAAAQDFPFTSVDGRTRSEQVAAEIEARVADARR